MSSDNQPTEWWQIILGFVVIIGICIGAFFLVKLIILVFSILQKEVIAAIIAAAGTVIVSVVSITVGKYYEKKLLIERQLRLKKIPIYHEFIEFWFRLLMSEKLTGKKISEKEMLNFTNNHYAACRERVTFSNRVFATLRQYESGLRCVANT